MVKTDNYYDILLESLDKTLIKIFAEVFCL